MNAQQIERLLHDTKRFDAVYSADTLPVKNRGYWFVISGNHWITIWVDDAAERGRPSG